MLIQNTQFLLLNICFSHFFLDVLFFLFCSVPVGQMEALLFKKIKELKK